MLTIEQEQRLEEIRLKGQTDEGLSIDEIKEGIELLRVSRTAATKAGAEKRKKKKEPVVLSEELQKLADMDNFL